MRLSEYFLPLLRENPSEAQIVSHRLMLRAGMIRQSSAGIYSWLPLGLRVLKKVEQIVREEQDRAGAQEILMPTIQPAELWRESGRYDDYGSEMLRVRDRHDREMLYGPTNEEQITDIVRTSIKSYRDLPKNLYHIQWKFRDEVRPRFGVMRGREFLMQASPSELRFASPIIPEIVADALTPEAAREMHAAAGQALESPYEELLDRVRSAPAVNVDETGWRLRGAQRTLWGAFTQQLAVFSIEQDRHEQRLRELLGSHQGVVTSDRWWAYDHLPLKRRQVCWSHLQRDFQAHAEGLGSEREFGQFGLQISERVFWAWEVYQHTHCRRELRLTVRALRRELKPILRKYSRSWARYKRTRGMARNLLKIWPALWTFAERRDVEPTNNHAERALRGAVIYRKLSLGSQSEQGEQRIERLLSASITCRLQRRSLFVYLSDLLAAHARGDPAISLA